MTDERSLEDIAAENESLLHAMQTGVKATMDYDLDDSHSPKHLRVGINNALIINSALMRLLVEKGLITEKEFELSYNTVLREEVLTYELSLSEHLKTRVTLK